MKAAVSAGLMWLVLRNRDFHALFGEMSTIDRGLLVGAALILVAGMIPLAARWSIVLHTQGARQGLQVTFPLILIGRFFGQVLPSGVGADAARIWLSYRAGLSASVAASSVIVDRLIGLLSLLLIVTAATPALLGMLPGAPLINGLLLTICAGYLGFVGVLVLDRLPVSLCRFQVVRGFRRISADFRRALLSPSAGPAALVCGLAAQIGDTLAVFALGRGLDLPASLGTCLVIVPLANILQALPISVAGWGVRETFFVAAFGLAGVRPSGALSLSIMFGLLGMLTSLPGGLLWLLGGGRVVHKRQSVTAKQEEDLAESQGVPL